MPDSGEHDAVLGDMGYIPKNIDEFIRQLDVVLTKDHDCGHKGETEDEPALSYLSLDLWIRNN